MKRACREYGGAEEEDREGAGPRALDRSAEIALSVLTVMHERNIPRNDLARRMGTSPEHVNRILRGTENLTLECISRLEQALGAALVVLHRADNVNIDVAGFEKISALCRGSARPLPATPRISSVVIPSVQDMPLLLAA